MDINTDSILVLVVDDDLEDQKFVKLALKKARICNDVKFLNDGEELMDYLHRRGEFSNPMDAPVPGLILLDLNMPKKYGREGLREIKSDHVLKEIPVVILTTSEDDVDVHRAYEIGANSFVTKPVTMAGMVNAMSILGQYWFEIVRLPGN